MRIIIHAFLMEQALIKLLESHGYDYLPIDNLQSMENIYHLFQDGTMFESTLPLEWVYIGLWYKTQGDIPNMKTYYEMAIEHGNDTAMTNLGHLYNTRGDIPNMKKYYEMAIEHGNTTAMTSLGHWYKTQGDIPNMKTYCEMAIERGNAIAMNNLGYWYKAQDDIPNMKKYCEMAVEHGNTTAMTNLGYWYKAQGDLSNMKKYYELAIEHGNTTAMNNLGHWYKTQGDIPNMKKYYELAIEHGNDAAMLNLGYWYETRKMYKEIIELCKFPSFASSNPDMVKDAIMHASSITLELLPILVQLDNEILKCPLLGLVQQLYASKIELIDLHFKYAPTATGCLLAKQDFMTRLTSNELDE